MKKIIIIGGGPAGMMAAIAAANNTCEIILFEKNDQLGKKLLLSGKGRCNLTNMCEPEAFLKRFSKKSQFLRDAFKCFFNNDLVLFLKDRGLATKVERQNRVFPITDKSRSVLKVLLKELEKKNVDIQYQSPVKELIVSDQEVQGVVLANGKKYYADRVILATGGISYPETGSTGDGFKFIERWGHSVIHLRPGLVALETKQSFPKRLMGLTLRNIQLTFCSGKKRICSDRGELLFTDFGVSGPLVLSLSGKVVDLLNAGEVTLSIDLKPALNEKQVETRVIREIQNNPRMNIKNFMNLFLPIKLAALMLELLRIDFDKKVSHISSGERKKIITILKSFRLDISKARPMKYAMVTQGGVSLKEINPKTMESRLIKRLYFSGEILDVDADTGGFNLQAAFSTGYLAGISAMR